MNDRLTRFRACLDDWEVDGVLVTGPINRRWLSGFTGSAARLLITRETAILSTDSRYWEQALAEAPDFDLYRHKDEEDDTLNFLRRGSVHRIGAESRQLNVADWQALQAIDEFEWQLLDETVEPLRVAKLPEELAAIRAAAAVTDHVVGRVPELARPGMRERDLAWELEKTMRDAGADRPAFDILVASGPNSAMPHHHPGDRRLALGDVLIVDLGAEVGGYKSDLTRTFHLGPPSAEFTHIFDIVHRAQRAAIDGLHAGANGKAVDALARDLIKGEGYGENFGHGTGHSLGLEIHENPRLRRTGEDVTIPADAVMTVEPGIYIPGWGGIRIEDLVLVTTNGAETISRAPYTPIIEI